MRMLVDWKSSCSPIRSDWLNHTARERKTPLADAGWAKTIKIIYFNGKFTRSCGKGVRGVKHLLSLAEAKGLSVTPKIGHRDKYLCTRVTSVHSELRRV